MLTKFISIELLATAVSATQYFGSATPDLIGSNLVQTNSRVASTGVSFDYAYRGDMYGDEEFGKFLDAANITSGYAYDRYTGASTMVNNNTIVARDDTLCNTGSKLTIRTEVNFNACAALASLAGGGAGGTIGLIASGAYCAEAATGQPTNCNILWTFVGGSVGSYTSTFVNRYCPELLGLINNDCDRKGGDAGNADAEVLEDVSQTTHESCDEITVPCSEVHP